MPIEIATYQCTEVLIFRDGVLSVGEDSVLRRVINLPQELIHLIVRHFSLTDLKIFRVLLLQA